MNGPTPLARLAERMGIEPSYWDISGRLHETTAESQRALLVAMGCDVSSDDAIGQELHEEEARQWARCLPPVCVSRTGAGPGQIDIRMPARILARYARWKLVTESDEEFGETFLPAALDQTGARVVDGSEIVSLRLSLPYPLPEGYHRLYLDGGERQGCCRVIVAPPTAYRPHWIVNGRRQWGWTCALYGLRSEKNWGIGDFSDLGLLAGASHGASVIGLNPLHSLFTASPEDASPYSPSSRVFLNPLYIDITAVDGFASSEAARRLADSPEARVSLASARQASRVDYTRVTKLKIASLDALYGHFSACHPLSPSPDLRRQAFSRFLEEGGEALQRFSLYEALQEHFNLSSWTAWPAAYQRPDSPAVAAFARTHADRLDFFAYVQWQADEQLAAAAGRCADAGMSVGLYRDLAVGANPFGADVWCEQDLYAQGARIGAPPDAFNANGQDWGLPPLHPSRLRQAEYEPFVRTVRANMRHAGALRIDHAMALQHLFWLIPDQDTAAGAYVSYPFDDLLGILALESQRSQCIVIGEDLGTVPDGFRARMSAEAILSYCVLFFERHQNGLYRRPDIYPKQSVSIALTHDMPTIRGYWQGTDLAQRREIGLISSEDALRLEEDSRENDKRLLLAALGDQDLLPKSDSGIDPAPDLHLLVEAMQRYLARTPSCIMLANMDDALLETDQLNMPGTVLQYPNWRRKLSMPIERFARDQFIASLARAIAAERKNPAH